MIRTLRAGLAEVWSSTATRLRDEAVDSIDAQLAAGHPTILTELAAVKLALADLVEAFAKAARP